MACPDCEPLAQKVQELEALVIDLRKLVTKLEARLAVYENANVPSSQKRFPEKREEHSTRKPGRPPGFQGSTRITSKPDKTIIALADQCSECNAPLAEPIGFVTKTIEEIPEPQPVIVTEFQLAHYICTACGGKTTAIHPDCPEQGVFGQRLQAQVALLKYVGRLPCKLVCQALQRDYGLLITPATVLAINSRVANALEQEYALILQRIRLAKVLYVDETSFHVGGVNYWLWIFTTTSETFVVIRQSRSKKVLNEILRGFDGVIVCDGWKTYSNFTSNIQRCWAHLLREAEYAAGQVEEAKQLYKALRKLYWKLVNALKSSPPPEKRLRLKRNALKTIERLLAKQWKEWRTLKVAGYLRNGLKHWFTFVVVAGVEPTNNRAERALREHVVIRKIIGTLRSASGVRDHEVITSVLATWRLEAPKAEHELRQKLAQKLTKS